MKKTESLHIIHGAESYASWISRKKAVLCLHGFTGNPCEMKYLSARLEKAGFSVNVPRLPGHGTSIDDMIGTDRHDWLLAAREAYLECAVRCEKVYIAGHSMGGLLTAILAAEFSPEKIALLSTPCDVPAPAWQKYMLPAMGVFMKVLPDKNPNPDLGLNWDEPRKTHICYSEGLPVPKLWDLFRLSKAGMKALPRISAPALVCQSSGDRTIPAESADIIMRRLGSSDKKQLTFSRSNHVMVNDYDRDCVADAVIDFFEK